MIDYMTPHNLYGVQPPAMPSAEDQLPAIAKQAGRMTFGAASPVWSPDNPLMWFGVLLGATFGLIGFATAVRVGPAGAAVKLGKT